MAPKMDTSNLHVLINTLVNNVKVRKTKCVSLYCHMCVCVHACVRKCAGVLVVVFCFMSVPLLPPRSAYV